jgi:spermidine/putrescine transport system permease protein
MLGQLRRVISPEINAISTVLVSLSISVVGLFFLVDKKFGK